MSCSYESLQSVDALRLVEKLESVIRKRNLDHAETLVGELVNILRRCEIEAYGVNSDDAEQLISRLFPENEVTS